jgi:acetyl esterase/lipase
VFGLRANREKERTSFLKKRSKKLLDVLASALPGGLSLNSQKFFGSFFQKRTAFLAACLKLFLSSGAAHAQVMQRDIPYGPAPEQMLDYYKPAASPAPLIVFVHGGGWSKGGKQGGHRVAEVLRNDGYAVASINYRLLGPGITIQDQAADVAHASEFLLSHAREFGIDPRHFALVGHSAGGHLVALVGADASYAGDAGLDFGKLSVVIAMDGVFNLDLPQDARNFRGKIETDDRSLQAVSPIDRLDAPGLRPAFCLIHENTQPRFVAQADAFAAALHAHGDTEDEEVSPGLSHVELVTRFPDASTATSHLVTECLKKFLKE